MEWTQDRKISPLSLGNSSDTEVPCAVRNDPAPQDALDASLEASIETSAEFIPAAAGTPAWWKRAARGLFRRGTLRRSLIILGFLVAEIRLPFLAAAWAFLIPGLLLHFWAKGSLWLGGGLATSGPYRWTRNPFYLANALIDLGICLAINQPWVTAAYGVAFAVAYFLTIRSEESDLEMRIGPAYRAYRDRVPRFFPRLWPASGLPASRGFSWANANLVQGREFARVVRTLYAPLIVWVGHMIFVFLARPDLRTPELVRTGFLVGSIVLAAKGIEYALGRTIRDRTPILPESLPTRWLRWAFIAATAGAAVVGMAMADPATRETPLVGLACGAAILAGSAAIRRPSRVLEGAACLAVAVLAGLPWVGAITFGALCMLALEDLRRRRALEPAPGR